MSIKRAPRPEGNFYLLDKRISEDRRLSWNARGMLVFLLGKPDHWEVSVQALINETADSCDKLRRDGVYRVINDLVAVGYIRREQGKSDGGTFASTDYIVSETAITPLTVIPEAEPLTAQPDTVQPLPVKPTLVSTEGEVSIEKAVRTDAKAFLTPPDWLDKSAWAEWVEHRKQIKTPLTKLSVEKQFKQLEEWSKQGFDPKTIIDSCIAKGYRGLFLTSTATSQIVNNSRHVVAFRPSGVQDLDIPF